MNEPHEDGATRLGALTFTAIFLTVPAAAVLGAPYVQDDPQSARRLGSAVLEGVGTLTLAWILAAKWGQLDTGPSTWDRLKRWLRRVLPWLEPKTKTMHAEVGSYAIAGDEASGTVTPGPDASLERRVEILEEEIKAVRSKVSNYRDEAKIGREKLRDSISELRRSHQEDIGSLRGLIRDLEVGSFRWEAAALTWIVVGVVVSVWPGRLPGY